MNRQQLVDAVGERLGDRRTAAAAVEAVLETVSGALAEGEKVSIFGFGVFEKVDRAARTARNPATGAAVQVPATSVPRFRPGQALKDAVGGRSSGRAAPAPAPAAAAAEVETPKGKAGRKDTDKKRKSEKGEDKPKSKAKKGKGK
jgi:DNA-binding protein HU-beta